MTTTLDAAFDAARALLTARTGGVRDPGILVRIEFQVLMCQVNMPPDTPAWRRPPDAKLGINDDDLRTLWEYWPIDRQADFFTGEVPPGAGEYLSSGLRSMRAGLVRSGDFLGQFSIAPRDGGFVFACTHAMLAGFVAPVQLQGDGSYRAEHAVAGETSWDPRNPPAQYGGWMDVRFRVLGVGYVA
jgi:hypothetical protein